MGGWRNCFSVMPAFRGHVEPRPTMLLCRSPPRRHNCPCHLPIFPVLTRCSPRRARGGGIGGRALSGGLGCVMAVMEIGTAAIRLGQFRHASGRRPWTVTVWKEPRLESRTSARGSFPFFLPHLQLCLPPPSATPAPSPPSSLPFRLILFVYYSFPSLDDAPTRPN